MEIPRDDIGKQGIRPWLNAKDYSTKGLSGGTHLQPNSPGKTGNPYVVKTFTENNGGELLKTYDKKEDDKDIPRSASFRSRQKTVGKTLSKKRIDIKVDALVGGIKSTVQRDFDNSLTVGEVIKIILKRFPDSEQNQTLLLWIPACDKYKTGVCMDVKKKLIDYDEDVLTNMILELRPKPGTLRTGVKTPSLRGKDIVKGGKERPEDKSSIESVSRSDTYLVAPKRFLADPNARITVVEKGKDGVGRSLALAFEFTDSQAEWSNPDKEGELLKQGSVMKRNWKIRWCVLAGNKLFVFRKHKDDEPTVTLVLKGGSITKSANSKQYAMDLTTLDSFNQKYNTYTLAAQAPEDFTNWFEAFERAIKKNETNKGTFVSANLNISFTPQEGYVGLPAEWKQMLTACGITERYFYERPEEVLQMLRYYRSTMATPLKVHPTPKTLVSSIDDVVTKDVSPEDIYEDFVLIGSGTFGEVYRALNKRSQQKVAIKKMLLTPKREPLFISEINVQKNTEHPNVVKLFDAYKVEDHIWVVLEYMEGGNLYQILSSLEEAKQLLTEPHIAYLMTETLKALSYIHGMHRIHRDIKSDNILIGRNAEIKLADFGYAVQLTDEEEKRTTMAGSPYWMAPEIIEGEEYGKEVDLWSLGIMAMECADLQPPYINEPPSKALMLITTQDPPPLQKPERWSRELKHFVSVCLQRDPHKRPMSIELLQHPLLRVTCQPKDFRDSILSGRKNAKPCLIQ